MNILFDLTATQPSPAAKFHGGGYYGEVIFFALLAKTRSFIAIYNSKFYINPKILESGIKLYDINCITPKELVEKEKIDIFYTPLYNHADEWQFAVKRYLITWHGLRDLELPINTMAFHYAKNLKEKIKIFIKLFLTKRVKSRINKQAHYKNSEYITVSEHSKASIMSFYPHLYNLNIPVFYSPFLDSDTIENCESNIILKEPYFLLTSSARWGKNNLRAVWAFDELFSEMAIAQNNFKVVLTGVTNEKIYTKKLKNKERFVFLSYVERAELLSLHKNAYAFIYPSLNEGFGYPPIESMRYGIPVAASGTSSIPEICGNAAIYFDPYSVSEIKNRIIQLLNKEIYTMYAERAKIRYAEVTERQKNDLKKSVKWIAGGEC